MITKAELEKENAALRRRVAKLEKQFTTLKIREANAAETHTGSTLSEQSEDQLARLVERLALATRSAEMGIWDWDIEKNILVWDDQMYKLYGQSQGEFGGAYEAWLSGVHPDDRAASEDVAERAQRGEIEYDTEFRVVWPNGMVHWLKSNAQVFRNAQGAPVRMVGVNYDITERKQAEKQLNASRRFALSTLDVLKEQMCVLDEQGQILFVNRAWREFADANPPTPPNYAVGSNYIDICDAASGGDAEIAHAFAQGIRDVRNGTLEHFYLEYPCNSPEQQCWFIGRVSCYPSQSEARILITHEDITARKNAERIIRRNELRQAAIFQKSAVPMALTQMPHGVFADINEAFQTTFGYSREEVIGKTSVEIGMAIPQERLQTMVNVEQLGSAINNEKHLMTKSGELRIGLINVNRTSVEGQDFVITTIHDITERKRAEQALLESEQRLSSVLINSPDTIYSIDLATRQINFLNRQEFCGYTQDELQTPDSILRAIDPEDVAQVGENWQHVISQGKADPVEYRLWRKDGGLEWIEQRTTILQRNPDHTPRQILVTLSLVTERKHAQDKLRRLSHAVEQSPASIVITDTAGNIEYVNPKFTRLTGYTLETVLGKNPRILKSGEMTPAEYKRLWETITQGKEWHGEFHNKKKNGELYWEQASISPIFDSQGRIQNYLAVKEDITERKRAEEQLQESEERFRTIFEDSHATMMVIEPDSGRIVDANRAAAAYYGYSRPQLISIKIDEINRLSPEQVYSERQKAKDEKRNYFVFPHQLANGELRTVEVYSHPIKIRNQVLLYSIVFDITERKQAEEQLQESEQKYRNLSLELEARVQQRTAELQDLYDNAPAGYHSLDTLGNIINMNRTELNWLGYTLDELRGCPFSELLTTASQIIFQKNFPIFKQQGKLHDLELEMIRKDGSRLPISLNATAIYDEAHNFVMSRTTLIDISDRQKAEQAIRESEETYRALFETSNDAIFLMDLDTNYVRVNPRCPELLGFDTAEELIGRNSQDFIDPPARADAQNRREQLLAKGRVMPYERIFRRKDGTPVETEVTVSLIRDERGNPQFIQSVVRDITQRKIAEEAMRLANIEMERAMRLKDEFLAGMSHELRTPLNAILGLSEAMQEQTIGPLNEKQLKALDAIESGGRHLLALINDILDLSKIEARALTLSPESVDVKTLCEASLLFVRETAHKKNVKLLSLYDPDVKMITVDERRAKQMLVNLLTNAVMFTPEGGQVGLEMVGDRRSKVVRFTVWDTGIGITKEGISRLFKPFVQLDSGLTRQYEGTGLGLSLVARMAELHGGSVSVESEVGKGSRFTILLPWSETTQLDPQAVTDNDTGYVQVMPETHADVQADMPLILIAEDNEANVLTLSMYLESKGYRLAFARNGNDALALAHTERPAVILMDLQMPGLDGLEATRRLRIDSDPQLANVPIIALTALAMPGDRERALAAGANEYMSKPVNLKQLVQLINSFIKVE